MGSGKRLGSAPRPAGVPGLPAKRGGAALTFASGGWVITLALLVMLAFTARMVLPGLMQRGELRGDGKHVDTYGFELEPCLVPLEQITPGVPKDLIKALTAPAVLPGSQLEAYNLEQRERYHRKFVVSTDRVAGVVLNGEARAYPLNVLCWHEACNDTVGGWPICVTFSPLCDSVVVFDRRSAGTPREFGVSGLLYNSNLLLYDRQPGGRGESLWSQLGLRAIAGPAARQQASLALLPVTVTNWADWQAQYPATTVILGDPLYGERYNTNPYGAYLQQGRLKYPVDPAPANGGPEPFERILAVHGAGGWQVYRFDEIAAQAGSSGVWRNGELELHYRPESRSMDPPLAYLSPSRPGGATAPSLISLWFAWQAQYPALPPAAAGD